MHTGSVGDGRELLAQELAWVPPAIRGRIDRGELADVTPVEAWQLAELGDRLGARVVAYRPGANGRQDGLCSHVEAAVLDRTALEELRRLELQLHLTLVAYQHP